MTKLYVFLALAWLGFCGGVSYALAHAGHPSALWWWRDVLGVLP